ncbi:MAG: DcaP family trimeric outer membrane transporter, partial [Lactococcus lactis]|nr:DcaP family trimeric outer membrane transporter [Lactococcus lactis]
GVGVGAKFDITPVTSVKADYYHVKGDSSFVSFTNPGVVATGTSIEQSEFDSITVGLTQKFNDKLRGTLAYGYMTFDKNQDYLDAVADDTKINKNLWQAWGNLFYSPVQPVSLGVEYVYGEREAFAPAANGSKKGEDNRVNLVAIYNF